VLQLLVKVMQVGLERQQEVYTAAVAVAAQMPLVQTAQYQRAVMAAQGQQVA
jgi:hypothetical protein